MRADFFVGKQLLFYGIIILIIRQLANQQS